MPVWVALVLLQEARPQPEIIGLCTGPDRFSTTSASWLQAAPPGSPRPEHTPPEMTFQPGLKVSRIGLYRLRCWACRFARREEVRTFLSLPSAIKWIARIKG